jgi:dCMP deaminase
MERPSWDELFIRVAEQFSRRSTCARLQTAAVLVKDQRIVSVGYNGVVPGATHCYDIWQTKYENGEVHGQYETFEQFLASKEFYDDHHTWSVVNELHGEQNAILFAGREGIPIAGTTLYTLYAPCIQCAKVIIAVGIIRVVYQEEYKRDTSGVEFLKNNSAIRIEKIKQ